MTKYTAQEYLNNIELPKEFKDIPYKPDEEFATDTGSVIHKEVKVIVKVKVKTFKENT